MSDFPKITVVTPSFNQAEFLERTIRSVLDQNYPNLEYIIIDGGSTDGSVDIIRRYEDRLAYWISERDNGQTEAINKGLKRATGEWVGWQNSDDVYYPGAFNELAMLAKRNPAAGLIIGDMMLIDERDHPLRDLHYIKPSYQAMLAEGMILTNQSAFWRRDVHAAIGYLDETLHCSFDYEWFLRLTEHVEGEHIGHIWGALRLHGATKTSTQSAKFVEENKRILAGREMPGWKKKIYKMRRLVCMLKQGRVGYVLRGLSRHAQGKGGDLY